MNLTKNVKMSRVAAAAAAAQTAVKSSGVSMLGFDSAVFLCAIGAVDATGTVAMKLQEADVDSDGSYVDLEGATAAAGASDDGKCIVVEVACPRAKYLRAYVTRGTADSALDGIFCFQGSPSAAPVTHDASIVQATLVHAPEEST
jgi:hypothetical protein